MRKTSIQRLTRCSILTALICLLTMFPRIALPSGYVHLGDGLILFAVTLLGAWGIPAAAVGSMLADLLAFPAYAPATFLIKGAMALAAWAGLGKAPGAWRRAVIFVLAEGVMLLGYFAVDSLFFPEYALVNLPGNAVQGLFGVITGLACHRILPRIRPLMR